MKHTILALSLVTAGAALAEPTVKEEGHLAVTAPYSFELVLDKSSFDGVDYMVRDEANGIEHNIRQRNTGRTRYKISKPSGPLDATLGHPVQNYLNPISWMWPTTWVRLNVWGSDPAQTHLGSIGTGVSLPIPRLVYQISDRRGKAAGIVRFHGKGSDEVRIMAPEHSKSLILATIKRDGEAWKVEVRDPARLDHRLVKGLAVFLADRHFRENRRLEAAAGAELAQQAATGRLDQVERDAELHAATLQMGQAQAQLAQYRST